MHFNAHWNLRGKHSFLSPSSYSWVNYTPEHLMERYAAIDARKMGTRLHEFAEECIRLGRRQPDDNDSLNMFVNDAIDFGLSPEQVLYYSRNCFGTSDAIGFSDGLLRVHDLKTGSIPAKMTQLHIYAALFCLEYDVAPGDIDMELRIYQNNDIYGEIPNVGDITHVIDRIRYFDDLIEDYRNGDSDEAYIFTMSGTEYEE